MFWGFTKDQLQKDQAAKLVGYLENDELAFRAVAVLNLQEITGRTHSYIPNETPLIRRQPLRAWQEELRTGKIVPARTGGTTVIRNSEKSNLRFWEFKVFRGVLPLKSFALPSSKHSFRFTSMSPKRSAATAVLDQQTCREIVANCACFNFRKASRSVTQLFDQILRRLVWRSTQLVILVTCEALGPCGLVRLARELVMDRSTVTRNLRPLISQGFLQVTGKSGCGKIGLR